MPPPDPSTAPCSIPPSAASPEPTSPWSTPPPDSATSKLTNTQGQFAFELLPPGDYTARVTSEGMSPQVSQTLHVEIGGVTDIAFKMTLGGAARIRHRFRRA